MMEIIKYITPNRFDLMAKLLYIRYGYFENINFYKDLYTAHIKTFNNYWEHPGIKTKKEDFVLTFNNLIENIKNNGYNDNCPIISGNNNTIINGSHRLMCSYYFNVKPKMEHKDIKACDIYNYNFFKNRNNYWKSTKTDTFDNLEQQYMDIMALEYINIKKNTMLLYLYPIAYDFMTNEIYNNMTDIISKYGYLYYDKNIKLTKLGLENIIKELYRGEKWIGGIFPNNTGGKFNLCHSKLIVQNSKLFIVELNDMSSKNIIKLKTEIRCLFNIGKHSIHIPDTYDDSLRIAKSLLNKNTIDFYNKTNMSYIDKNIKDNFINYFEVNDKNKNNIYIDSGLLLPIKYQKINNNSEIEKKEICYDPTKHYYINGFKFSIFES
jgi:hypothetical protein